MPGYRPSHTRPRLSPTKKAQLFAVFVISPKNRGWHCLDYEEPPSWGQYILGTPLPRLTLKWSTSTSHISDCALHSDYSPGPGRPPVWFAFFGNLKGRVLYLSLGNLSLIYEEKEKNSLENFLVDVPILRALSGLVSSIHCLFFR